MLHGINVIKHPGIYDIESVLRGPSHQNPAGLISPVNANHLLLENCIAEFLRASHKDLQQRVSSNRFSAACCKELCQYLIGKHPWSHVLAFILQLLRSNKARKFLSDM